MKRRAFITLVGWATYGATYRLMCQPLKAQQRVRIHRIGFLSPAAPTVAWIQESFQQGLRELGYVEGQNVQIEYRWAHGRFDRLPSLASELLQLNVDVIVAMTTQGATAAKAATSTIPIVMVSVSDPVGVGLVHSLARPGTNVTGPSNVAANIVGKQLEMLREFDASLSQAAVLWNPANPAFQSLLSQAEVAAQAFGMKLQVLEARQPGDFDAVFEAMRREGTRALVVLVDPLFSLHRQAIVQRLMKDRVFAISGMREFAAEGGLVAYGPSFPASMKLAAVYVDKIVRGAKPSDLPIEQPTKFELVLNLSTAKAFGVAFPPTLLARADEVIE